MTTYPPTPGPSEPDPEKKPGETEEGGTPFSGNQPGPASTGPEPGWNPPGANPEGVPHPTHGETPGESPRAPSDEPFGGIPPAPPPPGAGPGAPGGGYSPYGGAVPPPPPPPPAYNGGGPLRGQEPKNGLGTAALVCGIAAIVLSFIPGLNTFTWPLGVLAIVFGAIGWSRANKGLATNKPFAITGLVLGIVSFFTFCLIYVIIGAAGGGMEYDAARQLLQPML